MWLLETYFDGEGEGGAREQRTGALVFKQYRQVRQRMKNDLLARIHAVASEEPRARRRVIRVKEAKDCMLVFDHVLPHDQEFPHWRKAWKTELHREALAPNVIIFQIFVLLAEPPSSGMFTAGFPLSTNSPPSRSR